MASIIIMLSIIQNTSLFRHNSYLYRKFTNLPVFHLTISLAVVGLGVVKINEHFCF